jgi:DNA-binding CsgD family transcriptional regulator
MRSRLLVFLHDPEEEKEGDESVLCELYCLTRKEGLVATLLAQGLSPAQIEVRLNIRRETVKSHLKALYQKTSTHSQSQLVARVLGGLCRYRLPGRTSATALWHSMPG